MRWTWAGLKGAFKDWSFQLFFGFAILNVFLGIGYILILFGVDVVGFLKMVLPFH